MGYLPCHTFKIRLLKLGVRFLTAYALQLKCLWSTISVECLCCECLLLMLHIATAYAIDLLLMLCYTRFIT